MELTPPQREHWELVLEDAQRAVDVALRVLGRVAADAQPAPLEQAGTNAS